MAGLIVQVPGRRFAIPVECPCCGAPPDTELHLPRARGAHAAPDSAAAIDVPYCSRCMRHAEAWDHAGVGSAFVLVLGVLAFIIITLVAARPLLGLFALLAAIPINLIVAGASRRHARAACTPSCASPGIALAYQGYNGTLTSIAFESLTYAARFAEHNTGIVLETPQLRRLLEGHRIARLQVPPPAAAERAWRHSGDAGARRSDRCQHVPHQLARLAEQVRDVLHRARRARSLLDRNDHLLELDHAVECRVKTRERHEVRPLAHAGWMQLGPRQLPGNA